MDLDQLAAAAVLARGTGPSMSIGAQECQATTSSDGQSSDGHGITEDGRSLSTALSSPTRLKGMQAGKSNWRDAQMAARRSLAWAGNTAEAEDFEEALQVGHEESLLDSAAATALQAFTSGARSSSSRYHSSEQPLPSLTFDKDEARMDTEGKLAHRDDSSDSSTSHSTPECSPSYKEGLFDDHLLQAAAATSAEGGSPFPSLSHASSSSQIPYEYHPGVTQVPPKKQKGRRPAAAGMELKNHKCPHLGCAWSFSRREHLKRHEKTHTQERPFTCDVPVCGLKFSRLDNLNSHKRTHEKGKRTAQWHVAKIVGTSTSPVESDFPHLQIETSHTTPTLSSSLASFAPAPIDAPGAVASKKRKKPPVRRHPHNESSTSPELDDEHAEYSYLE